MTGPFTPALLMRMSTRSTVLSVAAKARSIEPKSDTSATCNAAGVKPAASASKPSTLRSQMPTRQPPFDRTEVGDIGHVHRRRGKTGGVRIEALHVAVPDDHPATVRCQTRGD